MPSIAVLSPHTLNSYPSAQSLPIKTTGMQVGKLLLPATTPNPQLFLVVNANPARGHLRVQNFGYDVALFTTPTPSPGGGYVLIASQREISLDGYTGPLWVANLTVTHGQYFFWWWDTVVPS
jgi:hypothetical protein